MTLVQYKLRRWMATHPVAERAEWKVLAACLIAIAFLVLMTWVRTLLKERAAHGTPCELQIQQGRSTYEFSGVLERHQGKWQCRAQGLKT